MTSMIFLSLIACRHGVERRAAMRCARADSAARPAAFPCETLNQCAAAWGTATARMAARPAANVGRRPPSASEDAIFPMDRGTVDDRPLPFHTDIGLDR